MRENLSYFAWFYVVGILFMALFIRFYLYRKRQKTQEEDDR